MPLTRRQLTAGLFCGAATMLAPRGVAQSRKLTLYMGPPEATCSALTEGFEKASRIKPTFLRLSAGEAINRIRAERNNPQASVLYGIGLPSMMTLRSEERRVGKECRSR